MAPLLIAPGGVIGMRPDMSLPEPRSDATTVTAPSDWSIERAAQYFNMPGWGAGFFSVNEKGHVVVHPMGQPGPVIDLMDVVEDIRERNIGFPCVVRFQDVLRARVKQIKVQIEETIRSHLARQRELRKFGVKDSTGCA